jgi:hypothetical protein
MGEADAAPWMRWIGTKIGGNDVSPALAWLIQEGIDHPYAPRDWTVSVPEPSPVVIDFVADASLAQFKRYSGYVALETVADASEGAGELILYNFSEITRRGRLEVSPRDLLVDPDAIGHEFVLEPMARVAVPVRFRIPANRFVRHDWSVRFVPSEVDSPASVFASALYPNFTGMTAAVVTDLAATTAPDAVVGNRSALVQRRTEPEEARPRPVDGSRWLVTPGDALTEDGGRWTFSVAPFAGDTIPAVAELPLADGFVFPEDALLSLRFRLAEPAGTTYAHGQYFHIYFRTANGNLYGVMPWDRAAGEWAPYLEARDNYTLMFDGRANPPWRFRDNRVVSLVLMSWRRGVPLKFEVDGAKLVRYRR